ncbi:MAG: CAP domain-containing protein, partial [Deltaproteobacteria bacterium]|nr:CAP domain-containing protein [Deltaproteobacteria bacterium]
MRHLGVCFALLFVLSGTASANGEAVNGFPNWRERVMHAWTNRARADPQVEMATCGAACSEAACYTPKPPLPWSEALNRAARFHSDEMAAQGYFAHDSRCTIVSNINALYPATCMGAASCACNGGTTTAWSARVGLFGANPSGEIIASGQDPNGAFYQWLYESFNQTTCAYVQGPPTNGHRWNILMAGPAIGYGVGSGAAVGDFGNGGVPLAKIPSGSHYPRMGTAIEAWANWYDTSGPKQALVNVDGTCSPMMLTRGSVTNGAYRAQLTGLGSACHRYYFVFKDSSDAVVTFPTTGSLGIGPAGTCADWDTTRPALGAGCSCTPSCTNKQCGDDGCGGSC